jgi:hypothetical protein
MAAPTAKAEYERFIETFTYREDDGIMIPKAIREKAYQLAIDIIIVSVAREQFLNFDASPPNGYYGKATLIFQDCAQKTIDLSQPRQRIYEGRVTEAFQFWDSLIEFEYHRYYYDILPRFFDALLNALAELPTPPLVSGVIDLLKELLAFDCLSIPDKPWLELPLREVYINILPRSQYKIEISYTQPIPFTDGCGNERNGKSFQTDGEKDDGLPPDGVMPSKAEDPNNPFSELPNPSSEQEQGSFANGKSDSLGNVANSNIPVENIPDDWGYFVRLTNRSRFAAEQCRDGIYIFYGLVASGTTSISQVPTPNRSPVDECGNTIRYIDFYAQPSGNFIVAWGGASITAEIIRSPSLPPNSESYP